MTVSCSKPCCWLTMAGFFVFIGTIQWTAGLVLLKSKYVFLLSGPNFWTSVANIVTGCFMGIAAIVWKKPRKKRLFSRFSRQMARENLISALLVSSVILNSTTVAILIMIEHNTILAIEVEDMNNENSNLGSEILRFAYATSVVCPVVCVVVAAMVATERCCSSSKFNSSSTLGSPVRTNKGKPFLEVMQKQYDWVYDQEQDFSQEYLNRLPKGHSSPSSSGCDEVSVRLSMEHSSPMLKNRIQSTPTVEDIQSSLSRMSHRTSDLSQSSLETSSVPAPSGEVVAIQVHRESPSATNKIPVKQPLIRSSSLEKNGESEVDAAPKRVRTLQMEDVPSKLQRNKMTSFREVQREGPQNEPFTPSKRNVRRSKSPTMESIVEVPTSEDVSSFVASPTVTSGYASSPDAIEIASKEASHAPTIPQQVSVPVGMETPRKASSGTVPKGLYEKLRSESFPKWKNENKPNCAMIFDPYSLVGLNNLEIAATQYRNHAILRYLERRVSGN